jgi:hypothetical protein
LTRSVSAHRATMESWHFIACESARPSLSFASFVDHESGHPS